MKIKKLPPLAKWTLLVLILVFALYVFLHTEPSIGEDDEDETAALGEMEAQVTMVPLQTGTLPVILESTGTCIPTQKTPSALMVAEANFEKAQTAFDAAEVDLKNAQQGGLDVQQADLDTAAREAAVAAGQAKRTSTNDDKLLAENLTSEKSAKDSKAAMDIALDKAASEARKAELFRSSGRKMELDRLKAAVASTQADLETAKLDLENARIVYPTGDSDPKAGTSLFQFWISPQDAQTLQTGAEAVIHGISAPDGMKAKITSIGAGIDAETGLVRVSAEGDGASFLVGEAVTADITSGANAHGLLIPVSCLSMEDDRASVFLVDDKMIAHSVPVTVLARNSDQAVITGENLKEGSQVITDGNYNLPDGAHVKQGAAK